MKALGFLFGLRILWRSARAYIKACILVLLC